MFGPLYHLSAQMLVHILLMNAVAPLLVLAAGALARQRSSRQQAHQAPRVPRVPHPPDAWQRGRLVFPAMLVQLAALWGWHAPPVLDATTQSALLHLAMQGSLLLAAIWFWSAVLAVAEEHRWRAVLALLVTSKLFCLLGVLLTFAPRALYSGIAMAPYSMTAETALVDQQLAGLLMLVACPLTYLVCGVVIAARWLKRLDADDASSARLQTLRHAA